VPRDHAQREDALRTAAVALALALVACGPKPAPEATTSSADAPAGATSLAAPADVPGFYDPVSKTAESVTDTLELADIAKPAPEAAQRLKLVSGLGLVYELHLVDTAPASADIGAEAWTALLPVPDDAPVSVYAVDAEDVSAKAPNGGFCSPDRATFLALAQFTNAMGEKELQIAAFKDTVWPPRDTPPALCGAFGYVEHTQSVENDDAP
jgi:hypothetical protein